MKDPVKKTMVRLFAGMAVLCLWGLLFVVPAQADDKYWDAGDGDWDVGTNWDPVGVPGSFDKVYLTSSDTLSRTVTYHNTDTNANLNTLWIDATGAGTTMTLDLSGTTDSQLYAGKRYVGYYGTGVLNQASGHHGGTLWLGYESGSSGTYNFSGGSTGGQQMIGYGGTGVFTQTGGQNLAGDVLLLGYESGSSGTYNLIDGYLTGGDYETIGYNGIGKFIQSGGTHKTFDEFIMGLDVGGDGTYELSGGSLEALFEFLGYYGTGAFKQSGGSHTVYAALSFGQMSGSGGTYELSGGSLEAYGENIGFDGTGEFTQTGGTNTVTDTLSVGHLYGGGSGTYNLSGAASELTADTINVAGNGEMHLADGSVSAGSGGMTNQGLVTMAGATVSGGGGGMTNQGLVTLSGAPNTINNDVVNYGTFKATDTTVTFTGTYTEYGTYVSDPSTTNFNDWIIGATGVVGGGLGDIFNVSGDFINNSLMAGLWDTDQASLCLTGEIQQMALAGAEMGALFSGYDDNFAWGEFSLESGVSLYVDDGNAASGAALYVGLVSFADDLMDQLARIFSDYNIYYNAGLMGNEWLGGLTYDLAGSGQLIAIGGTPPTVPVPAAVWLLGTGLIGLLGLRRKFKR